MKIKGAFKSLFRVVAYLVDQPERAVESAVDHAKSGIGDIGDQVRGDDHTFYNLLAFAAGVGVGVGVGILAAPNSGGKNHGAFVGKVSEMSEKREAPALQEQQSPAQSRRQIVVQEPRNNPHGNLL